MQPTCQLAITRSERGQLANARRIPHSPEATKPGSPELGPPVCFAIKTAYFRPSEIDENKQIKKFSMFRPIFAT
jgi:hypothetical protein